MTHRHWIVLIGAMVLLAACETRVDAPTPTPSPSATRASATPAPTSTPSSPSTPGPSPPSKATATPTSPATSAPAGYERSCAAAHAWGRQVSVPFVCIDEPLAGSSLPRGTGLTVRGYAGGSFENNVVIEVRLLPQFGGTPSPTPLVQTALVSVGPDAGMPGSWSTTLNLSASGLPSRARVTAYFDSPRDGARVTEAIVDIDLR